MNNATGYSALFGVVVALLSALAAIRQYYLNRADKAHRSREESEEKARKQRDAREAAEQERRESRYDAGVWKLVEELRVEVGRLSEKVNTLEGRLDEEQRVNAELRADLNIARATIREQERKINEVERRQS